MYKVTDKDSKVITSSENSEDIAETLLILLNRDEVQGKPSHYIVASVEDPAELDSVLVNGQQ